MTKSIRPIMIIQDIVRCGDFEFKFKCASSTGGIGHPTC